MADNLDLPHPAGKFDFAISIAVVHHLSTPERRVLAIKAILETLKPNHRQEDDPACRLDSSNCARALIYVWALEQKNSRRGWDETHEQDVMVPWVMRAPGGAGESKTFNRYYHLYREGELENDIAQAGGRVITSGYEKDNWWAVATR